ncbi:MAG: succinate dehydrogenase assembly factor 4 [Rhizomicrobium sp.]
MAEQAQQPTGSDVEARIRAAGERANAEAEARRKAAKVQPMPPELGGPKGPEPTRYGDWEKKGITSDF